MIARPGVQTVKQTSDILLELEQPAPKYSPPNSFARAKTNGAATPAKPAAPQMPATMIGTLAGFNETGFPLVQFADNKMDCPADARSTIPLTEQQIGSDVLVLFEQGQASKPIIIGLVQPPASAPLQKPFEVKLDGEQLVLSADKEIVLRCGKSSITLTRAGKVLIRGAYLLSRSSGVNRIKGGSVQIN